MVGTDLKSHSCHQQRRNYQYNNPRIQGDLINLTELLVDRISPL
jgi:hypothetical protein